MISIPTWLFVILCICGGITLLLIITIIVDMVSEYLYQKHELKKYENKEKENGRK